MEAGAASDSGTVCEYKNATRIYRVPCVIGWPEWSKEPSKEITPPVSALTASPVWAKKVPPPAEPNEFCERFVTLKAYWG